MAPQHPPIPPEEFEQVELLAIEKEAIGLFISAHPLKEVREALRAAVDAPLSSLPDHKDGDWVTAGGIITQAKKIRTKKGDPMMFATLDDLEGAIEVLIFGKALAEYEGALGVDEVVLVRGRVDHGDKGTSLIAQTVDPFRPSVQEVEAAREAAALEPQGPQALTVSVDATALPATIIDELKHILGNHAGESEVVLAIQTSAGPRTLRLGEGYRVNETPSLRAELGRILGPAALQVG
jgi:DNA polymerase-3 subunit alpha